jgi:hypothetical protein
VLTTPCKPASFLFDRNVLGINLRKPAKSIFNLLLELNGRLPWLELNKVGRAFDALDRPSFSIVIVMDTAR